MLNILGSPKRLCDGLTRRDFISAGGLGFFGLSLADFLSLSEVQAANVSHGKSFGKAKACILLYLYGAPSQLETFDMKPNAPAEIRGELKSVRSSLPGCDVCELLPNLAKVMDKVTVVRSMTHPHPIHGVAFATTGTPTIDIPMELNPHDGRHWPYIGSVVDYCARTRTGGLASPSRREVPGNIALPWAFSSQRVGEVPRAGPYAAFLGGAYNPIWTEFHGQGTRTVVKNLTDKFEEFKDPYMGITPESHFELSAALTLPPDMTLDRLSRRRSLVDQFDQSRRTLEKNPAARNFDRFKATAYSLIGSDKVRNALDIQKESPKLRDSYGMTLFGQAALAARRLVEAGSRFVSVFWDEYGLAGSGWDTHWDHYPRMKDELLPGLDRALYGLLSDLDQRGMLDDTLVLCLSEHGRTPKMQNVRGGGRDHWSQAYSVLLAGGGIARGRIVGKTDKIAGTVVERPVSPKDILATTYHLLGIDPHTMLVDRTGRPLPLVQDASVVPDVIA